LIQEPDKTEPVPTTADMPDIRIDAIVYPEGVDSKTGEKSDPYFVTVDYDGETNKSEM
jgi:hypothetical protein